MKTILGLFWMITALFTAATSPAQGTFVYDQQSSDENNFREGAVDIQLNQTIAQSFIPSLSSVGFVRLYIYNGILGDLSAADIRLNLRANSITGTIIGQSEVISIPAGAFAAPVNFIFTVPVSVTSGVSYYFQPVVLNNDNLGLLQSDYGYSGGNAFNSNVSLANRDFWFREGIIVPEPSSFTLAVMAGVAFVSLRKKR